MYIVPDVKEMMENSPHRHRNGLHVGHGAACVLFLNHLSDKARWVVDPECGPLLEAIKKKNLLCLGDGTPFLLSPESSLWLQC